MIIDAHVHLVEKKPDHEWVDKVWPGQQIIGITAEQILEKMDNCKPRIDKAVVFGLHSLSSESPEAMQKENNYILKVTKEHPDRLIGAGVLDPSWGNKALEELSRFVKQGLRVVKIRFSSFHYHANSVAGQRAFSAIEDLGVLPVCHSDWTHYSNPLVLGDLAGKYPGLKMIMQHFGEYLSFDALSVCKQNENIYVDTSALVYVNNIKRFIDEISQERIIFASDTLSERGGLQPQDALNRVTCIKLPKEKERLVLGENASKLLRSVGVKL